MRTVRYNTFETNSSSCHSLTTMSVDTWEKFKNNEVLFNRSFWDIEEHTDINNSIDDDNYKDVVKSFDEVYALFEKALKENMADYLGKYRRTSENKIDAYIYEWMCKNITKENFKKWLTDDSETDYEKIEPPIKIRYPWSGEKATVYDHVDNYLLWYTINNIFESHIDGLSRAPYIYTKYESNAGWEKAKVYGKEPKTFTIKVSNSDLSKDSITVSDESVDLEVIDKDTIKITMTGDAKAIIEREEEC